MLNTQVGVKPTNLGLLGHYSTTKPLGLSCQTLSCGALYIVECITKVFYIVILKVIYIHHDLRKIFITLVWSD